MLKFLLAFSLLTTASAFAEIAPLEIGPFDEAINFQPGLNLYPVAQLKDLFGTNGSELCAPIAMTHGFTYLRYAAGFKQLAPVLDLDNDGVSDSYQDKIRYFFQTCQTDKQGGTRYSMALACMKAYIQTSGYKPYSYMVGPHSVEAQPGLPLQTTQHVLNITDFRTYVGNKLMVVMGLGWYEFNSVSNTYSRVGGHFVNIYGYDYNHAWGEQQMILKVVNSWIDYSGRAPASMFDNVAMTHVPSDGTTYPSEVAFELKGVGFQFSQRAFVEDLFVALPQ
ncbi:MAG: hypothetical protein H7328_05940 [Bdellovibrio sp.]|nr:hypothetical protein [Bdellovibrio sp.]